VIIHWQGRERDSITVIELFDLRFLNYYSHLFLEGLRKFRENFTRCDLSLTLNFEEDNYSTRKKNTNHSKVTFTKPSHSFYTAVRKL